MNLFLNRRIFSIGAELAKQVSFEEETSESSPTQNMTLEIPQNSNINVHNSNDSSSSSSASSTTASFDNASPNVGSSLSKKAPPPPPRGGPKQLDSSMKNSLDNPEKKAQDQLKNLNLDL